MLVSGLDDEALVYDFSTHRAHCLNRTARAVFARCDGVASPAAIAQALSVELGQAVPISVVRYAIDELAAAGLLVSAPRRRVDLARRRAIGQIALTAGLSIALPAVWSIVAPTRAEAASAVMCVTGTTCVAPAAGQCCGAPGTAAMSCSGNGACNGNSSACMGLICS